MKENHDENLARLVRLEGAIQRANTLLLSLSPEKAVVDSEEPDHCDGRPGVQTLKDCISTAETVRDTFESTCDPNDQTLMQFSDNFEYEASNYKGYGSRDLDGTKLDEVSEAVGDGIGLDELYGLPNPDHDEPTPMELLSSLIDDLRVHTQKDLDAGNPKRAEMHLVEAIKLAEERENRHGTPFKDRIEVHETLAVIYQNQMKWAEAKKNLYGLIQESDKPEPELAAEKTLQHSRQYLMLATVYLEMYQACPSSENPQEAAGLRAAERFAKLAFNKRYRLCGDVFDQHNPSLLDCVQALITIYEAQGKTVLAESYRRKFMPTCPTTRPLSDEIRRSINGSASSVYVSIDIEDLFISAIRTGEQDQIQSFLNTADVNCRCSRGRTPLMYAVEQENEVTVRKLLDHGAEIDATTASGATALHQAVVRGNGRMARLLLELDADIEAKDKYLATPLLRAVEKNHGLLVSYLLGQSAHIHVKDKAGWTLLHHAAHNGAVDVLKHLLYPSHEVDVNATCPAGKTALHYCAELTMMDAAKILLEHGADVDALDASSRSPLFFAVKMPCNQQREEFATMLLENGATVDMNRLPARYRSYRALQNHISGVTTNVSSSTLRRGSGDTTTTSRTTASARPPWLRRFSLNKKQAQ